MVVSGFSVPRKFVKTFSVPRKFVIKKGRNMNRLDDDAEMGHEWRRGADEGYFGVYYSLSPLSSVSIPSWWLLKQLLIMESQQAGHWLRLRTMMR